MGIMSATHLALLLSSRNCGAPAQPRVPHLDKGPKVVLPIAFVYAPRETMLRSPRTNTDLSIRVGSKLQSETTPMAPAQTPRRFFSEKGSGPSKWRPVSQEPVSARKDCRRVHGGRMSRRSQATQSQQSKARDRSGQPPAHTEHRRSPAKGLRAKGLRLASCSRCAAGRNRSAIGRNLSRSADGPFAPSVRAPWLLRVADSCYPCPPHPRHALVYGRHHRCTSHGTHSERRKAEAYASADVGGNPVRAERE